MDKKHKLSYLVYTILSCHSLSIIMEIGHIAELMANEAKNEFLGGFFMAYVSE